MRFFGSHNISTTLRTYLWENQNRFTGKDVLDFPAGRGETARLLDTIGARVRGLDLFPELFDEPKIPCQSGDLNRPVPIDSESFDFIICQEGIEHVSDQPAALKELSRLLRPGGSLLLTTPNPSNLRSRLSHLLGESEHYKLLPPNEIDTVWLSEEGSQKERIYFGHSFLITFTKLIFLAQLSGLSVRKVHYDRANNLSTVILPFIYPFTLLASYSAYRRSIRKRPDISMDIRKAVYGKVLKTAINPKNLIVSHIFIEFEKSQTPEKAVGRLKTLNKMNSAK